MSRRSVFLIIGVLAVMGIIAAGLSYARLSAEAQNPVAKESGALVRPHSPIIGPANAPVTIVEFFDPSCEGCRAFYPFVKKIMAEYPNDVRLVVRYVFFHKGSVEAVRILEAARKQGVYEPVLEAVLAVQPKWHDDPKLQAAWNAADAAGLNVKEARQEMMAPDITALINQDASDTKAVGIRQTPTFFVNGKPLQNFGPEPLYELVRSEVEQAR